MSAFWACDPPGHKELKTVLWGERCWIKFEILLELSVEWKEGTWMCLNGKPAYWIDGGKGKEVCRWYFLPDFQDDREEWKWKYNSQNMVPNLEDFPVDWGLINRLFLLKYILAIDEATHGVLQSSCLRKAPEVADVLGRMNQEWKPLIVKKCILFFRYYVKYFIYILSNSQNIFLW